MADENLTAQRRIDAVPLTVFAVVDPANHAAIDGTGWVRGPRQEGIRVTAAGEVFDMAMFHPQHPDGDYEIANRVVAFEPPLRSSGSPASTSRKADAARGAGLGATTSQRSTARPASPSPTTGRTQRRRHASASSSRGVNKLTESLDNLATLTI